MILITLYIFINTMTLTESSRPDSPYSNVPPPRFVSTPTNITVRPGDSVILPCSIQHLGTKRVAWRQVENEKFLTIGSTTWIQNDNFVIQHKEDEELDITVWDLYIKNVTPDFAGEYECQTTDIAGHSRRVYLQVIGTPITKPDLKLYGNQFVEQGHKIHLICNATGGNHIPEEIDWFKDGDLIEAHKYKDIIITKYRSLEERALISELMVDHSDIRHAGTYICRSSQDEIDKLALSVLVADTTNVKRGTGQIVDGKTISTSGGTINYIALYIVVLLTLLTRLPYLVS